MKESSSIVSAIQHLKMAQEYLQSFCRAHPASKGAKLFDSFSGKIDWIFMQLKTHPFLPDVVREGIRREIAADVFAVPAIAEKIALIPPDEREEVENVIDAILAGRKVISKQ